MPVPFILCRNEVTGATAEIPETALPHMSAWVPIDQPEPAGDSDDARGDDSDPAADPAANAPGDGPDASPVDPPPAPRSAKPRKAADTATTEKE